MTRLLLLATLAVGCESRGALVSDHDSAWINIERASKRQLHYCYVDHERSPICVEPLFGRPFAKAPSAVKAPAPSTKPAADLDKTPDDRDYTSTLKAGECGELERANGEKLKLCPKPGCAIRKDFSKGELTEVCP